MMKLIIGLDILYVKKVALQIVLFIIFQKSKLTDNFLPIEKLLTFHNFIILIKSVVNKNKNEYYYIIF